MDNQPIVREGTVVIHNAMTNQDEIWKTLPLKRHLEIDSEIINALAVQHLQMGIPLRRSRMSCCHVAKVLSRQR